MKQRKFKFSLGIKIASILSCLALVSIGFASWWIVQVKNDNGTKEGSFTVYEVKDKDILIDNVVLENSTIIFGTSPDPVTPVWLLANTSGADQMTTQSLVATLTFKVSTTEINLSEITGGVTVKFTPDANSKSAFDAAIDAGYIAAPVITASYDAGSGAQGIAATQITNNGTYAKGDVIVTLPAEALATTSVNVTVTFTFGWGDMTDGKNPYDYFNAPDVEAGELYENADFTFAGVEGDKTNKAAAKAMLGAIHGLGSAGYDVTIDATVKSN